MFYEELLTPEYVYLTQVIQEEKAITTQCSQKTMSSLDGWRSVN